MTTILNFITDDLSTLDTKFKNIQFRYFDPFSISITTETNKQIWFSEYLNKSFTKVFGDNLVIDGFEITNVQDSTDNYTIDISKGLLRIDSVFVEITDDIRVVIPKNSKTNLSGNTTSTDNYLFIYVTYKFVKSYPYNYAKLRYTRADDLLNNYNGLPITVLGVLYKDSSGNLAYFPSTESIDTPQEIQNLINQISQQNSSLGELLSNSVKPITSRPNLQKISKLLQEQFEQFKSQIQNDIDNLKNADIQLQSELNSLSTQLQNEIDSLNNSLQQFEQNVNSELQTINQTIEDKYTSTYDSIIKTYIDLINFEQEIYTKLKKIELKIENGIGGALSKTITIIEKNIEILDITQDQTAPVNITIPNNRTYQLGYNSLDIYLNGLRLIPIEDYEEIDSKTVKIKIDLKNGDNLIFDITNITTKTIEIDSNNSNNGAQNESITTYDRFIETLTIDQDQTAPVVVTIPNGKYYKNDYNHLAVYLNRLRLIPKVDYEEVNESQVKFLKDLKANDVIIFDGYTPKTVT